MYNFEPLGLKVRDSFGGSVFGHFVLKGDSDYKFFKYFHLGFFNEDNIVGK